MQGVNVFVHKGSLLTFGRIMFAPYMATAISEMKRSGIELALRV